MATYNQGSSNDVAGESNARAVPAVWATGVNPATHARDGVAFTLHALGSGFAAGSVLNFDGVDKATTVVSPTDVSASITLLGTEAVRTAPVVVKSGNGVSSPVPFSVT
jgi:hypothetical protein